MTEYDVRLQIDNAKKQVKALFDIMDLLSNDTEVLDWDTHRNVVTALKLADTLDDLVYRIGEKLEHRKEESK